MENETSVAEAVDTSAASGDLAGNQSQTTADASDTTQSQVTDTQVTQQTNAAIAEADLDPNFPKDLPAVHKSWSRVNETLANLVGKPFEEFKTLPFDERLNAVRSTWEANQQKLLELEAAAPVGLIIDKPLAELDLKAKFDELPEAVHDAIVDHVFQDQLAGLVNQVLPNPQAYPEHYAHLDTIATAMASAVFGRPIEEINAIMQLTRGVAPDQLANVLNGQGAPTDQRASQGTSFSLAQKMIADGWQADDPYVAQVRQMELANNQTASQLQTMQTQLQRMQSALSQVEQGRQAETLKQATAQFDERVSAARKGALDAALNGRVPQGKEDKFRRMVDATAKDMLESDPKAKNALQYARDFLKDGLEVKATGQLNLYSALAARTYLAAAKDVLDELVSTNGAPVDGKANKTLVQGVQGGGQGIVNADELLKKYDVRVPEQAGQYAAELLRMRQG